MARAYNQAQKFGVEMAIPDEVTSLEPQTGDGRSSCCDWPTVSASAPARW